MCYLSNRTLNFYGMPIIILYATILVALVLFAIFGKHDLTMPSGRSVPSDDQLLKYSIDELETWSFEDLFWLENYAATKPKDAFWDDLLRRIDVAINGF